MNIEFKEVTLPDFGLPEKMPVIPASVYSSRLNALRNRMRDRKLDVLIIYGDREHNANTTYLTGYDPRFEESILIVHKEGDPILLVGNEGWGYASLVNVPIRRVLYQSLSLLGQDRSRSKRLDVLLEEEGISRSTAAGLAGWKYFSKEEFDLPDTQFEVPSYLADAARSTAGTVVNASDLFMHPEHGLRIINEADQLALFEFASSFTSEGLRKVLFGIRPGMTELEACTLMNLNGFPLSAHPMLSSGARAAYGLPSPSDHQLSVGEPFTMALGYWGALNARAGWFVENEKQLPHGVSDYLDKLAIPYFRAIARWYKTVGLDVTGGDLYDVIHQEIGDPFFGLGLNPGHYIHIDEWVSSPVYEGSSIRLKSGMALQVDVIPATGSSYHTINIEDGIALADDHLRSEIARKYPHAWRRIEARRKFMRDYIGIALKPEVLPFSNIPAYLPPFILSPSRVLTLKQRAE
ncbi:MAG: aminopeptidase P family N-terminal domain-containing protein [Bacteroidetes bacterium]|nr:aminopeptidase P family N-terminal domain-containing protein [Bacteroidota bacterium]